MTLQEDKGDKHTIGDLREFAVTELPSQFTNYFLLGEAVGKYDPKAIICSRKPELLYVISGVRGVHYLESENTALMLQNMLDKNVDYVIFEQMGFGSTYRYLLPCLEKHTELFPVVAKLENPETYLFLFD